MINLSGHTVLACSHAVSVAVSATNIRVLPTFEVLRPNTRIFVVTGFLRSIII